MAWAETRVVVKSATCTVIDENVALSAEIWSNTPEDALTLLFETSDWVMPSRIVDRLVMSDMAWECEADAYPDNISSNSDMSDVEWVCPSRDTELPSTVISEASILPNSTYERDIDTFPVTVKSPKVADWAETVSNDVVAYSSVPL